MTGEKDRLRHFLRHHPADGCCAALCRNILEHPWFGDADIVLAYAALPDEPDLTPVLEAVLSAGKTLALPRCESDGSLTARRVRHLSELAPGKYGISEPPPDLELLSPASLDLLLVPGMAFDRSGGRLGRGKGFYDRFLEHCSGHAAGICYGCRLFAAVPLEPHDQRMDAVITDRECILLETEAIHDGREKGSECIS